MVQNKLFLKPCVYFLYLSHLLYGICVNIFIMNRYISKSYKRSKNTIYRAGAAVVSTNQSRPQSSSAHESQECARSQKRKHWFREQDNHMTFGVASFAPERSEGANDATRDTIKLYARQKSCDYHYYQYIRTNHTNLFHMGRMFNMKSCCGRTLPFGPRKGAFQKHFLQKQQSRFCHLVGLIGRSPVC